MPHSQLESFRLGAFDVPRIWTGLWQLSSNAWGSASGSKIRRAMARHAQLGYTAFDMADHYGSAEILFGQFRKSLPSPDMVVGATKWCVFVPMDPTREAVQAAIAERMESMQTTRVDLLQFHWNDYSHSGYLVALRHLRDLQNEGTICALGLCNFDSIRTDEICTQLGPGVIVTNQVQFSLVDTRPLHGMIEVCERHHVKLLTYGTLCGGFLTDQWLNAPEPDHYTSNLTPSQRKYLDMIVGVWGSWDLFQALLAVLRTIGDRHDKRSIANVACRWVLDQPRVGAILVGARLGVSEHPEDNSKAFGFRLSDTDNAAIQQVLQRSNGASSMGDCGAEYRQ